MKIFTKFILIILCLIILFFIMAWGFIVPIYLRDAVEARVTDIESHLNIKIVYDNIGFIPFTIDVVFEEVAVKPYESFIVILTSKKIIVRVNVIGAILKRDVSDFITIKMVEPVLVIGFNATKSLFSFKNENNRLLSLSKLNEYFNSNDEYFTNKNDISKNHHFIDKTIITSVSNVSERRNNNEIGFDNAPEIIIENGKVILQRDSSLSVLFSDVNGRLGRRTDIRAKVFGESNCNITGSIMGELKLSETEVDTDVLKKAIFGEIRVIFFKSSSIVSGVWKFGDNFKVLINILRGEVHTSKGGKAFIIDNAGLVLDNKNITISNASLKFGIARFSITGRVGLSDRIVDITAYSPNIDANLISVLLFGKGLPNVKLPSLGSISIKIEGTVDKPIYRIIYQKGE
ncbi:MAG: hypothetical protein ACUVWP_00960 [bacterium]